MNRRRLSLLVPLVLMFVAGSPAHGQDGIDPSLLAGMQARGIGPAGMSGRVAAIDAVVANPNIIYVGAATGGLWKSVDGGLQWEPMFDDQPVAAIGAVTIFQQSPDIVWVGTGEGNPRNSVSVGNGVYRSLDAGHTWTHLGLAETERIHRIVLHPTDPDIAWVAALGRSWGENRQRGVFRTRDGGRTWKKVLYLDQKTGAADLVIDPTNPARLFAAMWDHRRWPWFFRSGGPGSGLYVTHDSGDSWQRLTAEDGLPAGDLGRIGIAIAGSEPERVYAYIEAEKENALYVSRDGGRKWKKAGDSKNAGNRPFYYADIRVDPERPDRVYSLWSMISVSDDGGASFRLLVPFRHVHPDHHAMWINPEDPRQIIAGNDGGVVLSRDRGETWRFVANLPLAQYYHIRIDMETPYNIYGGMQDNGSWRGPSSVWENGGIRNHHWEEVGFGDGFDTVPIPVDSRSGYAMSQEGYLSRWNLRTGERKDIRPPAPEGEELRFNWNAGIAIDPFDSDTLYYGSQYVHRSRDRGETWEIISGDMTTDNAEWQKQAESGGLTLDVTGAENFTSIITIAPSPVERDVLWVGTDDGRVHVTRDGGSRWQSIERKFRSVPRNTWVPHIEPSHLAAGTAFVVFDNHRRSDWTAYVFRSDDYGRTWTRLHTEDIPGYALAIVQDPVDPDLLYLGTEFGLYVSLDAGRSWFKWTHGVPTVSVMDLAVHPREHDLVLGTHGRAAFVLDDIRPLRELSAAIMAKPLHLFGVADAQQHRIKQTGASRFPGHTEFRGENRPYGALITFALNIEGLPHPDDDVEKARKEEERAAERAGGGKRRRAAGKQAEREEDEEEVDRQGRDEEEGPQAKIEILDEGGKTIRTLETPARLGVNRAVWDLRYDSFEEPPREGPRWFEPRGPEALPGIYTLRVSHGDHSAETEVRVLPDPRFRISITAREAKLDALMHAGALQETVAEAVRRVHDTRADLATIRRKAKSAMDENGDGDPPEDSPLAQLLGSLKSLQKAVDATEKLFWRPPDIKGIPAETDALSRITYALRNLGSSWDPPTPAQIAYLEAARARLEEVLDDFNRLYSEKIPDLKREARELGIGLLPVQGPLTPGS